MRIELGLSIGDKYDLSKAKYEFSSKKVCMICPKHGEFYISPSHLYEGKGCSKCAHEKIGKESSVGTDEFIRRSKEIHGYKYDYSKVEYIGNKKKVIVTCPKHGDFLTTPLNHVTNRSGCPHCRNSKMEEDIRLKLEELGYDYVYEAKFPWLGKLSLDFYIPKLNTAIECQGHQHFKPYYIFGGEEAFVRLQERDKEKHKLCKENDVKLLYYSTLDVDNMFGENIYHDIDKLFQLL